MSHTINISHRISSIINSDNIIYLENGEILEMGTNGQLIEKKGNISRFMKAKELKKKLI
jgi:ATP-binding cassette subfamily B protein